MQKSRLEQGIQAKEMFIKNSEEEIIELDRKVSKKFKWSEFTTEEKEKVEESEREQREISKCSSSYNCDLLL